MTDTNTRQIAKYIESKQYKKAIQASDAILKKHPEHGETLCMKGLTLSYLDKKEEAYDLVRKGLKFNLRSHVCWHVFGLLYRQDRDYFEAVKCYRNALKIDVDNIQILRDLSLLQIHRRDLPGFCETRKKLLQLKPQNKLNWIGYAISEHLQKNYETTLSVLDRYDNTAKDHPEREAVSAYDRSETALYKAEVMKEAGKYEAALEHLDASEKFIVDKLGMREIKGQVLMSLNRLEDAEKVFASLVETNPENHGYLLALMACDPRFQGFWTFEGAKASFPTSIHSGGTPVYGWLSKAKSKRVVVGQNVVKRRHETFEPMRPLTEEEETQLCEFFDDLREKYQRNDSLPRLLLFFLNPGKLFSERLDMYLRPRLRKGVPSLFRMIRGLYLTPGKQELIEKVIVSFVENLSSSSETFDGSTDSDIEPPTSLLFSLLLAAQHFDMIGDHKTALAYIERAREHTPTLVELHSLAGRILKHSGALHRSYESYELARTMDLADRFLNTESTKSLFRINDVKRGDEIVLLFSKETEQSTSANLHDMQCMWYECHVGRALTRLGELGKALKKFQRTMSHFADIAEDQFDFHNYCLRKTTLKTYIRMLKIQDQLFSHKFYRRAAKDLINIYLQLYDKKQRGEAVSKSEQKEEMSAAERKRLKHKQKKAQRKEEKEEEVKKSALHGKKVDPDPDGEKLLEADFMAEMLKLVDNLINHSTLSPQTHVLSFEVYVRQNEPLLALRSLLRLYDLAGKDATYYKLVSLVARFFLKTDFASHSEEVQKEVLETSFPLLGDSKKAYANFEELKAAANKFVDAVEKRQKENGKSQLLIHTIGNLRCIDEAGRDAKSHAKAWLEASVKSMGSLKDFSKAMDLFKALGLEQEFRCMAQNLFPLADIFQITQKSEEATAA